MQLLKLSKDVDTFEIHPFLITSKMDIGLYYFN